MVCGNIEWLRFVVFRLSVFLKLGVRTEELMGKVGRLGSPISDLNEQNSKLSDRTKSSSRFIQKGIV